VTTTLQRPPATAVAWRAPVAIGALAFVVSVIAIAVPGVWYDETATISSATRNWPQLWAEIQTVDAVHALYYAGMHVWFEIVGYTPFSLRFPSAVAVGIAAAFTVVLGRQLGTARLGIIGGIIFAVLPRTIWMGGEGRSYALTAAAAVILTVVLLFAVRTGSRRAWIAYAVLVVIACVLFVYLALVVAAHLFAVRRTLKPWLLAVASAGLVLAPFVLFTLGQKGQIEWISPVRAETIEDVFREQWFMDGTVFAVVGWVLLAVGAFRLRRSVLVPLVVLPMLVLLAATLLAFPVYIPRYLSMCLPFVALVMAGALTTGRRWIGLVLITALAVPQLVSLRAVESKEYSSWQQVASLVEQEKTDATAIVYGAVYKHPTATARVIQYAYPEEFAGTTDPMLEVSAADSGRLWEYTRPLDDALPITADTILLVTSTSRDLVPTVTATLAGWHVAETWNLTHVNVVKYERN
jgi:mannosyltransferase